MLLSQQGTTISINSQTSQTFEKYVKMIVKFHNFTKTTPDDIFINLHGKTTSSTTGHLVVYGVKGYVSNVDPKVYDTAFVDDNGKMVMETDLDMGNHNLLNMKRYIKGYTSNPQSYFQFYEIPSSFSGEYILVRRIRLLKLYAYFNL